MLTKKIINGRLISQSEVLKIKDFTANLIKILGFDPYSPSSVKFATNKQTSDILADMLDAGALRKAEYLSSLEKIELNDEGFWDYDTKDKYCKNPKDKKIDWSWCEEKAWIVNDGLNKPLSGADRQLKFADDRRKEGLVVVKDWIPSEDRALLKAWCLERRKLAGKLLPKDGA